MRLTLVQTDSKDLGMLQTNWAAVLNPLLTRQQNQSLIIKNVSLAVGSNNIPTGLDRALQGWKIIRQRAQANIYDDQDNNTTPAKSLILVSDAVVVIDLEIF